MTRAELQAVLNTVRAAHPGVEIELRPGLQTNQGMLRRPHFCITVTVRVADRVYIDPDRDDETSALDFLERELEELIELTSERTRRDVQVERLLQRGRAAAAAPLAVVMHAPPPVITPPVEVPRAQAGAPRSLWERLESLTW